MPVQRGKIVRSGTEGQASQAWIQQSAWEHSCCEWPPRNLALSPLHCHCSVPLLKHVHMLTCSAGSAYQLALLELKCLDVSHVMILSDFLVQPTHVCSASYGIVPWCTEFHFHSCRPLSSVDELHCSDYFSQVLGCAFPSGESSSTS